MQKIGARPQFLHNLKVSAEDVVNEGAEGGMVFEGLDPVVAEEVVCGREVFFVVCLRKGAHGGLKLACEGVEASEVVVSFGVAKPGRLVEAHLCLAVELMNLIVETRVIDQLSQIDAGNATIIPAHGIFWILLVEGFKMADG